MKISSLPQLSLPQFTTTDTSSPYAGSPSAATLQPSIPCFKKTTASSSQMLQITKQQFHNLHFFNSRQSPHVLLKTL
jgi:hypothetical protein